MIHGGHIDMNIDYIEYQDDFISSHGVWKALSIYFWKKFVDLVEGGFTKPPLNTDRVNDSS